VINFSLHKPHIIDTGGSETKVVQKLHMKKLFSNFSEKSPKMISSLNSSGGAGSTNYEITALRPQGS
jgi:hypothetical protein